ncbi:hypothetical protein HK099_000354 [Clydaea vesicula]|uniref:Non-specific serine/threonine protein kinase n=1 Tax=Clydaea vesicula TaxID=447962 RepID=A0AAD5U4B6_9FUNG|nr:hypothetical protein HK099_000354 [Clydaea vesicula]
MDIKLKAVVELRGRCENFIVTILSNKNKSIEIVQTADYQRYLTALMPAFLHFLSTTQPTFQSEEPVQKVRLLILEIITRLPNLEIMRQYVKELMDILLKILKEDNEDNAVVCLKIITDLHKNFKGYMEKTVFLPTPVPAIDDGKHPNRTLGKSIQSFKVLTECPIIIALLFQVNRKIVTANVDELIKCVISALKLQPHQQKQAHEEAATKGTVFYGVSPLIKNRVAYAELKALQIKVTFILKYFINSFAPHVQDIADSVVSLMKDCPPDCSSARKELLVATRHIWQTEFKFYFLTHIDVLLNENVMTGTGVTCRETLSSFPVICKYHRKKISHLNNVSGDLSTSNSEHDSENLTVLPEYQGYLDLGFSQPIKTSTNPMDSNADLVKDIRFLLKYIIPGIKTVLISIAKCNPVTNNLDPEYNSIARGFCDKEIEIFITIARDGLFCFNYFNLDQFDENGVFLTNSDSSASTSSPSVDGIVTTKNNSMSSNAVNASNASKEEKESLEGFAAIFKSIEPSVFQEVFGSQMGYFFELALINQQLMAVPQYFLATASVSSNFAGLLLRYLIDSLDKLGSDSGYAAVMLKIFKVLFLAVSIFPEKNEPVLLHHLPNLILTALRLAKKAIEPLNYFLLLRSLFRSISGGKFEKLYQAVLPILPILLETLNNLLATTQRVQMRELYVELCLTVPVRLSVLLPYLSHLMKPLVLALHGGNELVTQGLRTLELCIDNLTHEFLEPILSPVMNDLMNALWRHLHPEPYSRQHSVTALKIVGKLGGFNRRFLKDAPNLKFVKQDSGLELPFLFNPLTDKPVKVSLNETLTVICDTLKSGTAKPFYISQCFEFLKGCIPLLIDTDTGPDNLGHILQSHIEQYVSNRSTHDEVEIMKDGTNPFPIENTTPQFLLDAHVKVLEDVFVGLFYAAINEETRAESRAIINSLCRHFALLSISELVNGEKKAVPSTGKTNLDAIISTPSTRIDSFINGIVSVMSSPNSDIQELSKEYFGSFYNTCLTFLVSKEAVEDMKIFKTFASKFCSACYEGEWFYKRGGCSGILLLSTQLGLSHSWILLHEIEFVKALLFVLKDTGSEMTIINIKEATSTLLHVLELCNKPLKDEQEKLPKKMNNLVALLIGELSNSNQVVRETIQKSFDLLAELSGIDVTELLLPSRERLLSPIFIKPLRALPFQMQIGHIDAITYCLSLRTPLLVFNEELHRLLQEAILLADAEDAALIPGKNLFKNQGVVTNLRVVCIKLLSAALVFSDYSNRRLNTTRARIISVFFKSLYANHPEVVEYSNKGLQQVLATQHRLPKELLQAGLRPSLVNVSSPDSSKLTVSSLEGLARLLELLTNYFKVEIGRKLLDHLRNLAEPALLEEASSRPLSEVEKINVIVGIINVFYLLPAAANCFLVELINSVLGLEEKLKRFRSSPFRLPLIKFLNRYASESIKHFYSQISTSVGHNRLLIGVLGSEHADVLRAEVMKSTDLFISKTLGSPSAEANYHGVLMMKEITKFHPEWLLENKALITILKELWKTQIEKKDFKAEYSMNPMMQSILELFVLYLENDSSETSLLFDMIDALDLDVCVEQDGIKKFIYETVALKYSVILKQNILDSFFIVFQDKSYSRAKVATIIRMLIIPMLMVHSDAHFVEVFGSKVSLMDKCVWQPLASEKVEYYSDTTMIVELLQLTSLILQRGRQIVNEFKKNIIKFSWNYTNKVEEITCKQAAFVVIARFIVEFPTLGSIISKTFVELLKTHQPEVKNLVRQAMDSLLPILPSRTGTETGRDALFWIAWTRKIMIDDAHSSSQLVSIYQLIIRHSNLYYNKRDAFIPQIIGSLSKLGLAATSTKETKILSIDLAELIFNWENQELSSTTIIVPQTPLVPQTPATPQTQVDEPTSKRQKFSISTGESQGSKSQTSNYRDMLVTYLIRFLLNSTHEPISKGELASRVAKLLEDILNRWPECNIKFSLFDKLEDKSLSESTILIINALEIFLMIVKVKDDQWLISNIAQFQNYLNPYIKSDNILVSKGLKPILSKIFQAVANNTSDAHYPKEVADFVKNVDVTIRSNLGQDNLKPYSTIVLLCTSYLNRKAEITMWYQDIMKLLQKLANEHCSNAVDMEGKDANSEMITMLLSLLKTKTSAMGEQRKTFLNSLLLLIEKSKDTNLLKNILSIVSDWIYAKAEAFPTQKEKANLMVTLLTFANREDKSLLEDYLELVAKIFSDSSFLRTELSVRLENSFLIGTKYSNPITRKKFSKIFNDSVDKLLSTRLNYIFGVQNWEYLSSDFWICQALDLLLGSAIKNVPVFSSPTYYKLYSIASFFQTSADEMMSTDTNEAVTSIVLEHQKFLLSLQSITIHNEKSLAFSLWSQIFPICWELLTNRERHDLTKSIIFLLSKDYHSKQADVRPNVIQCLLEGIRRSVPHILLPPQLVMFLSKTFNAWFNGIELLQCMIVDLKTGNASKYQEKVRDSTLDNLADLYSSLNEDDYFYGLWRHRCQFPETNAAISFEQNGMWLTAQNFYEQAQQKARLQPHPFNESEYNLWEEHWVLCSKKLQSWDILTDLAKQDVNCDLLIDAAWHTVDWCSESETIKCILGGVTEGNQKKQIYEIFHFLTKMQAENESDRVKFQGLCDNGMQLALKQWQSLPEIVSNAHIPVLHSFQQFVEFQEAFAVLTNLSQTNPQNVEVKSTELKGTLQIWRDRLPNIWDDINLWSDLVSWRQQIFGIVNRAYMPLLPSLSIPASVPQSSFAYRGYHETAWIINRFAHVARKHRLTDVCVNQLTKIYTLPNIEIQEAFYKLREQAKCYAMNPCEWPSGLDVVNNTNLMYFIVNQRAEFFSLKGVFLSKLKLHEEAVNAFSSSVQIDTSLPCAWAAWGKYNDQLFKDAPKEKEKESIKHAADAINCYMHASTLYNSGKSRKYMSRILWLLSLDDETKSISKAYSSYKSETPTWYWINFIPQLISSLSCKEAAFAKDIILRIAKIYPQSLHFHLRTAKEDLAVQKKQFTMRMTVATAAESHSTDNSQSQAPMPATENKPSLGGDMGDTAKEGEKEGNGDLNQCISTDASAAMTTDNSATSTEQVQKRPMNSWDYVEEIMGLLKTAFPLLALSMETLADQIINKLKPTTDEDIYRLIIALLNDGISQLARDPEDKSGLSPATETNLQKFAETMAPNHLKYKAAFENDFIKSKPTLTVLVQRFREWRNKLETLLDNRPQKQRLEHFSHYLVEFEYQKFDQVEIPGQYLLLKDSNRDFIKIERFLPEVILVRNNQGMARRLTIKGHDGSLHPFSVQQPAFRQCRREERILQLLRLGLYKMIPLTCLYWKFMMTIVAKRECIRMKDIMQTEDIKQKSKVDLLNLKTEVMDEIGSKMIPEFLLTQFMSRNMKNSSDLWFIRKRFTTQMSAVTFFSYVLCIGSRFPGKFLISRETGNIWCCDLVPSLSNSTMMFTNQEAVPFRFTPNIHHFIGPIGVEGVFTSSLMAISKALTECDMENYLSIFIRDELNACQSISKKPLFQESQIKDLVSANVDILTRKAQALACTAEREKFDKECNIPANQTILDLISQAVNPLKLSQMDLAYMPSL